MSKTDLVTTEIIRNAFISIASDMNATLIRSAFSPVIYEGKDCAVALLDENGDVLGQSLGVALFLGTLDMCVKYIAEEHGWDYFKEGDVFILNDSYIAGTHLNDITIIMPIFWRGERIGFAANRAHWIDVGAKDPGIPTDSREIYQEGMRWGPTRLYDAGVPRDDVIDLVRRNSRYGDAAIGDLNAQIASCHTGIRRVNDLYDRFGKQIVRDARKNIFEQTALLERQEIKALPDGVYRAEGSLDNDGHGSDPLPVKVAITIKGASMSVDLTGTADQASGPVNCGYIQACSALRLAYKTLICTDAEPNGGSFLTLDFVIPKRTMLSAEEPAPCAWYFSPLGLLIDLFIKALSEVMPEKVSAAHYGDSMLIAFMGKDTREGASGSDYYTIEPTTGGWGGYDGGDGESSLINIVNGSFRDMPIEIYETKYPVVIKEYGIRKNSGGPGKYRGGNGTYRKYVVQCDTTLFLWLERSVTTAWGLNGGHNGEKPKVVIQRPGQDTIEILKAANVALPKGSSIKIYTGGGGGFGDPKDRDDKAVETDLLDGYLTPEYAQGTYGV